MRNFKVQIHDWNEDLVEVYMFTLLQWKHALKLEMKGLTHSQGSVYKHLLEVLSAPDTYSIEQMSEYIDGAVDSIEQQLGIPA